jgi:exodeoxyribonuclease V alpha subunit
MLTESILSTEKRALHPLDRLTGDELSRGEEKLFWLFCFLSAATRSGFSFVEITQEALCPSPTLFFDEEVSRAIREGFFSLPAGIFPFYVKEEGRLYLRRSYEAEARIRVHKARLENQAPLPSEVISLRISRALNDGVLSRAQASILLDSARRPLACLFGGPGTGKTYCAGLFLKFFLETFPETCGERLPRVALSGPTGKATANLEKMVHRALGASFTQYEKQIDVKTLHALLHRRRHEGKRRQEVLSYDLIIIDESSMIGAELMAHFLSSIGQGTRLLFLGDPGQLAPIEPGAPFSAWYDEALGQGFLCELEGSHRTEQSSIVRFAQYVRTGDAERALDFALQRPSGILVRQVPSCDMQKMLEEEGPRFRNRDCGVCFLSPCKDGPWGYDAVNSFFAALCGPGPIIITKNDYDLDLMNGEIGVLRSKSAIFPPRAGKEEPFEVPLILLSHYSPAFCLSVHKSQGSEFEKVVLLLPPRAEIFGRKMVYTAVTRAKKEIEIWSADDVLVKTISA